MTDANAGEMPIEPVPPIPPAPEANAELDAASPEVASVDGLAPAPDEPVAASSSAAAPAGDTGEVETEAVESFDPRISIPESLGPVRRAILEGLIDTEGADVGLAVTCVYALAHTPRHHRGGDLA
jgi:hypothetical protein